MVEQKVAKTSFGEVTKRVDEIESAKSFDALNRSEATLAVKQLEQVKKEWLDAKLVTLSQRKQALSKERALRVKEQLDKETAPDTKDKEKIRQWNLKGATLREDWSLKHKERVDEVDNDISEIEDRLLEKRDDTAVLLSRLNSGILKHEELTKNIESYALAAKTRNEWVGKQPGHDNRETKLKLEQQWDLEHPEQAVLVSKNQKYAKMNEESIERDRKASQKRIEERKPLEKHAREVCGPLLDAVKTAHPQCEAGLMTSLIEVLDKARHAEGLATLRSAWRPSGTGAQVSPVTLPASTPTV